MKASLQNVIADMAAPSVKAAVASAPTPEARRYALRELARRAGVQAEFLRSWKVEHRLAESIVHLGATGKRVRFRHAQESFWRELRPENIRVARAEWMRQPRADVHALVPHFLVPFACDAAPGPLFQLRNSDEGTCVLDVLASTVLTLSRYEELLTTERDPHGRFTARQSIACQYGFIERPIVDEYGLAFAQLLSALVPGWSPVPRRLRVKLSHDIDDVGTPVRLKSAIGHTLKRHNLAASARDLFSWMGLRATYLDCVLRIVRLAREYGLQSAVYLKASRPGPFDTGYDPKHPRVARVIDDLKQQGIELGVHPGYETFGRSDRLRDEVEQLRQAIGEHDLGGRQHYLRWSPQTWADWDSCDLAYDSTVGFSDHIGFRAGTCLPYRPWLMEMNRPADLMEIPLVVMDATLTRYMGLSEEQSVERMRQLARRCEAVGGVFTLLWHNTTLIDPAYGNIFLRALQMLSGKDQFDWRKAMAEEF